MELLRRWRDGGGTRFEGVCRFAVEDSTPPGLEKFEMVFSSPVQRFEVSADSCKKNYRRCCNYLF